MRGLLVALSALPFVAGCVDVGSLRGRSSSCDAGDLSCETDTDAAAAPDAGRGGTDAATDGAISGDGGSGSDSGATRDGGDVPDGGEPVGEGGLDAAPGSDDAGPDAGEDAGPGGGDDAGPDGGLDCEAIEDDCVSDADHVRSLAASTNECGFTCEEALRDCSLVESDDQCPQLCTHLTDVDCVRANRLFVTRTAYDGNLGGLAGADAKCRSSASSAGLQGAFIALLGSSTVTAETRLGDARGFVRVDGEPFADHAADLIAGNVFTAPIVDEYGEPMPPETNVATGFSRLGTPDFICGDWQSRTGVGDYGTAGDGGQMWRYVGIGGCGRRLHLYCTEVAHQVEVRPRVDAAARTAFVAKGFDPSTGIAGADETCMSAAAAAQLDGVFKALLPTSSRTPIERFDLLGARWARIDGTPIVESASDLASGRLKAPLNQGADGTYYPEGKAFTGTNDVGRTALESCKNWQANSGPVAAHSGRITSTGASFLSDDNLGSALPCSYYQNAFVYCLETNRGGVAPDLPEDSAANVVFVTEQTWNGNLGGLTGADAKCQSAAGAAGLSGTFIALLSTSTASAEQRLAGARGFVRPDGKPVAETARDLLRGRLLYPPDMTENDEVIYGPVWTGVNAGCQDFTSSSADHSGTMGTSGDDGDRAINMGLTGCDGYGHLYCAETARDAPVVRPSTAGNRLAFMARGSLVVFAGQFFAVDPAGGLAGLDAQCANEAALYGLGGTFGAYVATTSASASSRFSTTGTPWARVDGPLLAATAAQFLSTGPSVSTLSVAADGFEHFGNWSVWFGANDAASTAGQNCNNWSSSAAGVSAQTVMSGAIGGYSGWSTAPCNATARLFCLQF